ncbi:MAG: hypothetical protein ACHQ50_03010 [Fimbriimonadales bacterium]
MKKIVLLPILALSAAIAFGLYLQASSLYINGNLASSGMIERNGVAYVPLKDVATAFKLSVQKTARGYELSDSGGANQVEGIRGKVGDMLFNGYVRFQVVKVYNAGKSYKRVFSQDNSVINPIPDSNDLIVVVCKLKNAIQKPLGPYFAGGDTTALTDTDGHSYPPRRFSDAPPAGDMLPGSTADFALVFDIPPGTKLQDLVYEPQAFGIPSTVKKKFRISLGEVG